MRSAGHSRYSSSAVTRAAIAILFMRQERFEFGKIMQYVSGIDT